MIAAGYGQCVIALADDVPEPDVAAAIRHVETEHVVRHGVAACRPPCEAGACWRPAPAALTTAATA